MTQTIETRPGPDGSVAEPRRRARSGRWLAGGAVALVAATAVGVVTARAGDDVRAPEHRTATPPTTASGKIASALLGGPASIARNATLLDWPAALDGSFAVLRPGSNGWTCLPDFADTPAEDPSCADANSMAWIRAYYAGADAPHLEAAGISYWPLGTSDPSWSDPAALKPPPGQDWAWDGPHITVLPANPDEVPTAATPGRSHHPDGTMAMFPGTPWAHYHVPVP